MSKQKKWSSSRKFEIALLAIKNETTINDICKKYEVAPCQLYEWKKQLLEQGANLFEKMINQNKLYKLQLLMLKKSRENYLKKLVS